MPAIAEHPLADLFRDLGDELLGTAFHFTGNRDDAVEVYQEAFLKCWARRESLGSVVEPRAWVFQVLVNTARDVLRRRSRRSWLPLTGEIRTEGRVGQRIEGEETEAKLRRAIAELPGEEREVFVLRQNGELPYARIAQMLGVPEGTVKSRMRRALGRLREALD